jgi:hypothetical protein
LYDEDNRAVFDSLKSRLIHGPAWTWIQDLDARRDGREVWKALNAHFEGVGSQIRMKTAVYASIKRAEYKDAKNFDFELYKRIHTQAHADLKCYGEPVPETKKVKDFLDSITELSLQPIKYTIAGFPNLMNSVVEASNYIGQIIDLNKKTDSITRHVSGVSSGGRDGRGRGRGRQGRGGGRYTGRGGRGRGRGQGNGGRNTNAGRWISYNDWQSSSEEEKAAIRSERSNYAEKRKISELSTSEAAETTTANANTGHVNNDRLSGRRADPINAGGGGQMSRGNRNLIGQIRSSQHYPNQHQERSVSSIRQSPQVEYANAELDSHADTVVAGATCKVLEFTEHSCDIYLYSDQYEPMKSVPVAKVATAYDHPLTGETFRLVFGQALYLGDKK